MKTPQKLILALLVAANMVVLYLWYKNNKKVNSAAPGKDKTDKTVRDDMKESGARYLVTLSDREIKQYAGWLDRADSLAKDFLSKKGTNKELEYNIREILKLTDDNFRKVVLFWKELRAINSLYSTNLKKAVSNIDTYVITDFFNRVYTLNIN